MYQLEGDFKGLEVIRSGSSLNLRIIFEMFLMGIFLKFFKNVRIFSSNRRVFDENYLGRLLLWTTRLERTKMIKIDKKRVKLSAEGQIMISLWFGRNVMSHSISSNLPKCGLPWLLLWLTTGLPYSSSFFI